MTQALPAPHRDPDAQAAAAAAARAGGLSIHEVREPAGHRAIEDLLTHVWNTRSKPPPLSGDIVRMLSYTGAYVSGAYSGTQLVGAAVGFLTDGLPEIGGTHLHSHIAGVAPEYRGRQVGFALKLHQRAWSLERGFDRITWTFDPLVRRNAYFNLAKLGARASRYLVDFYGDMQDGLNAGQGSDRLLVEWRLEAAEVVAAAHGRPFEPDASSENGAPYVVLHCGSGGNPELREACTPGPVVCEIPADIESLRRSDPDLGRAWRQAVRSALHTSLPPGTRIAGFDRHSGYLLVDDARLPR